MARAWPGNSTVDYLRTPASAQWNMNTDVCLMGIVRLASYRAVGNSENVVHFGVVASRGYALQFSDINGILDFTHVGVANSVGTATTALAVNTWTALLAVCSTGGNASFKRYVYDTGFLATETNANTSAFTAPSGDVGPVGNEATPWAGGGFIGDIDRVVVGQGRPTDNEFVSWALTGRLPTSLVVKGHWILWDASPIGDLSGNANNLTLTGTTLATTNAPVGLFSRKYGVSPYMLLDAETSIISGADSIGVGDSEIVPV